MKYLIYFLPFVILSCQEKKNEAHNNTVHKIYYKDTSKVSFYAYKEDTTYNLKVNTYNKLIDLIDGDWTIYYDKEFTKKLSVLPITEKSRNGKTIYWYRNGQKKRESEDSLGLSIGKFYTWYKNGQLKTESTYKNDTIVDISKKWYENGDIWVTKEYQKGILFKESITYKNGLRREIYHIEDTPPKPYFTIEYDSLGLFLDAYKNFEVEVETIKDKESVTYSIPISLDSLKYGFTDKYKEELKTKWINL